MESEFEILTNAPNPVGRIVPAVPEDIMNKLSLNTLLIDDNEQDYARTRDLLTQLENWRVKLEWVSSYEAALAKMERVAYDVCLLNCKLNNPEGLEFLQRATQNGFATPLILLADSGDSQTAQQALQAGATDYLIKGQFDAPLLERSLRYAVNTRQLKESYQTRLQEKTAENERLRQQLAHLKRQTESLKDSEQQYRLFFDIDIYGVEVLDETGHIIDCNPTHLQLLGYRREDMVGKPITHFTTEASARAFEKTLLDLKTQGYAEGERELICQDGSTVLVWSRSQVVHNRSGGRIVTFSRDITERMKAVRQISTLARALEQSPVALMITDTGGAIEYANFEFTELTGYSYEEVIGKNLQSLQLSQEQPENYRDMLNAIAAGNEWQGELHHRRSDGETYWTAATAAPMFDSKGALTHFIVLQEDITPRKLEEQETLRSQRRIGALMTEQIGELTGENEALQREIEHRKQVEARLEAQYKGIPVPTYTWQITDDDDFVLIDYNNAALEESDGRIAQFKNQRAGDIFKNRPQVLGDFLRCSLEKSIVRREAPYKKVTTGETRHFVTTYNYVSPNLILVHIQDITEYKQLEEEWSRCREQLDALAIANDVELTRVKETMRQEMTRREKAELALREAEERVKEVASNIDERLREQYRSIPIPTYTWQMIGGEFILVDFNNAAAESMGRIVDFFGKPASEIFKNRPQVLGDFAQCYQEKRTVVREAPYKLITTGETRYFVTTYNYVPPNLVVDHIQDITEQKKMESELEEYRRRFGLLTAANGDAGESPWQPEGDAGEPASPDTTDLTRQNEELAQALAQHERAEESLRQSRVRLRAQYNGIPIPTCTWQRVGADFVLTDYNNAAEKITQGRIVDFMGKPASEVFKERPEVLADFSTCFTENKTVRRESHYQLVTADETKYYVTTYNFVSPNLVIVYIEDITQYKLIENNLRQGEEQIDLICRYSPQNALTFVNDAYCWYYNHSRDDLMGRQLPFVLAEDLQDVKMHFASLRPDSPAGTIELRVQKSQSDIRWQQWINWAIFDKHDRLIEIRSMGRDITRRKKEKG